MTRLQKARLWMAVAYEARKLGLGYRDPRTEAMLDLARSWVDDGYTPREAARWAVLHTTLGRAGMSGYDPKTWTPPWKNKTN